MQNDSIDIRELLLQVAGNAFINKTVAFDGDPYAYVGDDAVKIGLDLVDLVECLDREFAYKKQRGK